MLRILSKRKRLGEPVFNIQIDVRCSIREFKDSPRMTATEHIKLVGLAIHNAGQLLGGTMFVTDRGYLTKGKIDGFETRHAHIEAEQFAFDGSLYALEGGKEIDESRCQRPHIYFEGSAEDIDCDAHGLYIKSIHDNWLIEQSINRACE